MSLRCFHRKHEDERTANACKSNSSKRSVVFGDKSLPTEVANILDFLQVKVEELAAVK